MRKLLFFALVCLAPISAGAAELSDIEIVCGDSVVGAPGVVSPSVRIVFIRFPQPGNLGGYAAFPDWADPTDNPSWLEREIDDYVTAMSVGQQQPDVKIVADPLNPGQPWTADHTASYYVGLGNFSGECNREIFQRIHDRYLGQYPGGYWAGVNYIFVFAYDQAYHASYPVGGFNGFGFGGTTGVPNMATTRGFTAHLFVRTDLTPVRDSFTTATSDAVAGVVAHEYGHVLGMHHSPYSGNSQPPFGSGQTWRSGPCRPCGEPPRYHLAQDFGQACIPCGHAGEPACTDPMYVNMGRYDAMRGIGGGSPGVERVSPYHPYQLYTHTSWLEDSLITTDVRNFHVPQLRHTDPARRKVYRIQPIPPPGNLRQFFLLSNHQGAASSVFDANYQGRGLLIWHVLPDKAWDLESAQGESPDSRLGQPLDPLLTGPPYPLSGDGLAKDWCFSGGAGDFFDGTFNMTEFSATTNPNSNYYAANFDFLSPQSARSHIGVENIRQDASGDMVVDIYVDPKQYVLSPNGGEVIPAGNPLTVTWLHRANAEIGHVNIAISGDGGQSYASLATAVPNTSGQYTTGVQLWATLSQQSRIRITSYDVTTNAFDVSDVDFTYWGIKEDATFQSTVSHRCVGSTPKVKVTVNFATSIASDGDDQLLVYTSSSCEGTPVGTATVANPSHTPKTNHSIQWEGTCSFPSGTAFYIVVKSQKIGSGWAATHCLYAGTVTCISCGGGCNPPCEYE